MLVAFIIIVNNNHGESLYPFLHHVSKNIFFEMGDFWKNGWFWGKHSEILENTFFIQIDFKLQPQNYY